jgi:NAD(P)-dependent dehydrogenase (short-subunit alcohol dehydrogenase family)
MQTVLITGANRGIGLEFVRQYLANESHVIATCRQPQQASALHLLQETYSDALTVLPLDVASEESILACAAAVKSQISALDILVNNAGIPFASSGWESSENFGTLTSAGMLNVFTTNAVGPLLLIQALLDLLKASGSGRVAYVSSWFASIGERNIQYATCYSYSGSKVASNMFTKMLSQELAPHNIRTVTFNPGWVKTDMGGPNATQTPEEVVTGMRAQIAKLAPETSGRFITWEGNPTGW